MLNICIIQYLHLIWVVENFHVLFFKKKKKPGPPVGLRSWVLKPMTVKKKKRNGLRPTGSGPIHFAIASINVN